MKTDWSASKIRASSWPPPPVIFGTKNWVDTDPSQSEKQNCLSSLGWVFLAEVNCKKQPAGVPAVMAPGIHLKEKAKEIAGSKSEMSAMTLILITFLGPADICRLCMRVVVVVVVMVARRERKGRRGESKMGVGQCGRHQDTIYGPVYQPIQQWPRSPFRC